MFRICYTRDVLRLFGHFGGPCGMIGLSTFELAGNYEVLRVAWPECPIDLIRHLLWGCLPVKIYP